VGCWLLFVDLDGTLWDHPDVSSLELPFRRVSEDLIVDNRGVNIRLHKETVKLIIQARRRGAIVSSLSWNEPGHALDAIRAFGLADLFDYHAIDVHPRKGEYARRIVETVEKRCGVRLRPCQIVYIDDRDIHVENVRMRLGNIIFLQAWKNFRTAEEAWRFMESSLCLDDP
jgi:magnesium-dependent phosphatase-1